MSDPRRKRTAPARAWVSLGSNVEREANLPAALERLAEWSTVRRASRAWDTEAVGRSAEARPAFFNAAVEIETSRSPASLRAEVLKRIERDLGRVRTDDPDEPRTIDLDLVWWIGEGGPPPDPDLVDRRHLAEPLAEIAPDLVHPATGEALHEIAARLARTQPGVRCEPVILPAWERARARLRSPWWKS